MSAAQLLIVASAAIIFVLGSAHLVYTYVGGKLRPRSPQLLETMRAEHPGISRQTTMWRAWVGFNASHSLGALLFGAIYGYLAVAQPNLLFGSLTLAGIGLVMLSALLALAIAYWFHIPRNGIALALICYLAGNWLGRS